MSSSRGWSMISASGKLGMIVVAAVMAGGCANSGMDLSTASVTTDKTATALKTDPACISLASQINALKGDGTIDRLEKAASGKSAKVEVKREALQKQAELNKANADFQTRCGPIDSETARCAIGAGGCGADHAGRESLGCSTEHASHENPGCK